MMYPRLLLARQLLKDDGVIFVSIDDNEAYHLHSIMSDIFGEENFIAQLVWEKGRKNDAKLFSVGHEYMLVFARSKETLRTLKTVWREAKPGAKEIWDEYVRLRQLLRTDSAVENALRQWYKDLPKDHPAKALSRYKQVDQYGPWRDRDISWPGGGGPRYDVIHPKTGIPCKTPESGWRFATFEEMQRQIKLGLVVFREDHTDPPFRKAHLYPVAEEIEADLEIETGEDEEAEEEQDQDVCMKVMPSVIYKQSQVAVKYLRKLLSGKIFNNPKDHEVIARIIRYVTQPQNKDIILDFFSGSGTTAESILQQNRVDGGNRQFILVQIPEETPEKSIARRLGYCTIAEIGKERIRRVSQRMKAEDASKLLTERETPEDLGFKVFKLGRSHFKSWSFDTAQGKDAAQAEDPGALPTLFDAAESPLVDGWQPDDLLVEILLQEGFPLDSRITVLEFYQQNWVWQVESEACAHRLFVCLDDRLHAATIAGAERIANGLFICLDTALSDEEKRRLADHGRLKVS